MVDMMTAGLASTGGGFGVLFASPGEPLARLPQRWQANIRPGGLLLAVLAVVDVTLAAAPGIPSPVAGFTEVILPHV